MMHELCEQVRTPPQAGKASIQQAADLLRCGGRGVLQVRFDIPMTVFLRIELRRIGRKGCDLDLRMGGQIGLGGTAGVNPGAVPQQDDRAAHIPLQMSQQGNHLLAAHPAAAMPLVNVPGERQGHARRDAAPVALGALQHRAATARRPGAGQRLAEGEAKFIQKHDFCASALRFFLSGASLG